jgi:hypothetical protein
MYHFNAYLPALLQLGLSGYALESKTLMLVLTVLELVLVLVLKVVLELVLTQEEAKVPGQAMFLVVLMALGARLELVSPIV